VSGPGDESGAELRRSRRSDLSEHPLVITLALAATVTGALVAILGLLVANSSYRLAEEVRGEEQAVVLDIRPSIRPLDLNEAVAGLRVVILNESIRRIVIVEASLWMKDCQVGPVEQWLPDVRVFDRRFLDQTWTDHLLPTPITMEGRQGSVMAFMVPYGSPCVDPNAPVSEADYRRSERMKRLFA
jgi:hypothetical protein